QPARARNRRVIRGHLLQSHPQKTPQRQRIRRPPCNPALAVYAFEIPDQQQAEVPPRRQTRPSHFLRVEAGTLPLHPLVKTTPLQHSVQLFIERMRDRPWQFRVRDPKLFLSSLLLSSAHPHSRILRTSAVTHTIFFLRNPDLHHGLLEPPLGEIMRLVLPEDTEVQRLQKETQGCAALKDLANKMSRTWGKDSMYAASVLNCITSRDSTPISMSSLNCL